MLKAGNVDTRSLYATRLCKRIYDASVESSLRVSF